MISAGKNIHSATDILSKIPIEYLYHSIINPKPTIESNIRQLRSVKQLDYKQYTRLKSYLPYIVCGIFNPPYRKIENFGYTEYFILDIDNVNEEGENLSLLRKKIESDNRVLLSFVSPGEDGLKVMFKLSSRCFDSELYSIFYKTFSRSFSLKYSLNNIIDSQTSDVSRACFVSVDKDAHFNPNAVAINWEDLIHTEDISLLQAIKHEQDKEEKESNATNFSLTQKTIDPDKEVMEKIKSVLFNKRQTHNIVKEIFVPEEVDAAIDLIKDGIVEYGIELYHITPIQYGKKLLFRLNLKKAEINLFYGKRGFTSVKTPKKGTNNELNDICKDLVDTILGSI